MKGQRTLITGLWKNKNILGEDILVGKVGVNLTAMVVKNPDYAEGERRPEFLLYFANGRQKEVCAVTFDEYVNIYSKNKAQD